MLRKWTLAAAVILLIAAPLGAEDRSFRLLADGILDRSGLMQHLLPRFSLKTSVAVISVAGPPADVVIGKADNLRAEAEPAFRALNGDAYAVLLADPEVPGAQDFVDWLLSDIGQRTLAAYQPEGEVLYRPAAAEDPAAQIDMPEGDVEMGETLALLHCGRCHVVNDQNRMGGIGSTPSFAALRSMAGWQDKFLTFWTLNPHPSFTQVEGLTEPFDPDRPPHIAPVEITQNEMEAILAFTATIPPKDLGAAIDMR